MPKFDYSNVTTSGEFAAAARNIRSRGRSLKDDIQKVLVCGLVHMDKHGDYTSSVVPVLDAIKDACGKNLHVAAIEWVLKFSWLKYDEGEKKLVKDQTKTMNIVEAKTTDWWATERPAKAVPFDAQKAVNTLFDKAKAEIEAGRLNGDMFTSILLGKLREANPNLITDLFRDLSPEAQNEALGVMVAIITPANTDVVEEVAEPLAAVA